MGRGSDTPWSMEEAQSRATSGLVRQPACSVTGRPAVAVRTRQATTRPSTSSGAQLPSTVGGSGPTARIGRLVMPMVGTSKAAPSWIATPAPRAWSRPVPLTKKTLGGTRNPCTMSSISGPTTRPR